jgi:putative ABC transport system permease protein
MKSNIKLASRTLLKNKTISAINILGLTIGLSVSILIFFYVFRENTKDNEIKGIENIYVITDINDANDPSISSKILNALRDEVPELENSAYYNNEWSPQVFIKSKDKNHKVNKLLVASKNFFKVLSLPTIYGDANKALNTSNKIVLSKKYAYKLFGNENPVGKTIEYNSTYLQNQLLDIAAVVEIPDNSSWEFDAVIPVSLNMKIDWYKSLCNSWGTYNYSSICRLSPEANLEHVQEYLANIKPGNIPNDYLEGVCYGLVSFKESYFNLPELDGVSHGQKYILSVIEIVGVLILLLACLNFINLSTAQREKRAINYNIIKALGSTKKNLIGLITTETAMLLLASIAGFIILTPLLLEGLNYFSDNTMSLHDLLTLDNLIITVAIILVVFLLTSIITSTFYYQFTHSKKKSQKSNTLQNSLLIFQFVISIVLISSIFIIRKQNNLLNTTNPGFAKEHIIYSNTNKNIQDKYQSLYSQLNQIPEIADFTFSSEVFGHISNNWGTTLDVKGEKKDIGFMALQVSSNFFDFFGVNLQNGNGFNNYSKDNRDIILNQKAINNYNIENINESRVELDHNQQHGQIIGTVADFNVNSFRTPIKPIGFMSCGLVSDVVYIKINAANSKQLYEITNQLNKIWMDLSPDFPFEYDFLDHSWAALYKKDQKFQQLIQVATLISLFISCLGLIALTYFTLENKTKEIGIRKVNGAKVSEVLILLNKDFIKWVAIAFVIACPIAYYAMSKWLENFAYKTELSWWIFALAGISTLSVALITVSWQSWKAATRNPVEALRYE